MASDLTQNKSSTTVIDSWYEVFGLPRVQKKGSMSSGEFDISFIQTTGFCVLPESYDLAYCFTSLLSCIIIISISLLQFIVAHSSFIHKK